jgi:hypothetical protein
METPMKDTISFKTLQRVPALFSELENGEDFEWCATPRRECRKIDAHSFSEKYGTVRLEHLQGFGSYYESLDELDITHMDYVPMYSVNRALLTLWDDNNWTFAEEKRGYGPMTGLAYRACLNGDFTIAVEAVAEGMKVTVYSADDKVSLSAKMPADETWVAKAEILAVSCGYIYGEMQ